MDARSEPSGKKKRNRILTDDRRRQNREAQRRYRVRRKGTRNDMSIVTADESLLGLLGLPDLPLDREDSSLDDPDMFSVNALSWPNNLSDVFSGNSSFGSSLFDVSSLPLSPRGVLSGLSTDPYQSERLPSPYLNYLPIQKLNFYAARIQNALHMGLPLFLACKDEEISPWYWHTQFSVLVSTSSTVDSTMDLPIPRPIRRRPCFQMALDIISDLAPTPLQRSKPHSMYLDMIPFPIFRDRVITLVSMEPPAFNEDELKRDIENDGVMVWGTGQGSIERSGSLVRDKRNWECAEWFLKKWRLLVNGSGLEEQSEWWRRMRGED